MFLSFKTSVFSFRTSVFKFEDKGFLVLGQVFLLFRTVFLVLGQVFFSFKKSFFLVLGHFLSLGHFFLPRCARNYHTGRTGHESFTSKRSDCFFCVGTFIEGLFIISIVK